MSLAKSLSTPLNVERYLCQYNSCTLHLPEPRLFCPDKQCKYNQQFFFGTLKSLKQHWYKMHQPKDLLCGICRSYRFSLPSFLKAHAKRCTGKSKDYDRIIPLDGQCHFPQPSLPKPQPKRQSIILILQPPPAPPPVDVKPVLILPKTADLNPVAGKSNRTRIRRAPIKLEKPSKSTCKPNADVAVQCDLLSAQVPLSPDPMPKTLVPPLMASTSSQRPSYMEFGCDPAVFSKSVCTDTGLLQSQSQSDQQQQTHPLWLTGSYAHQSNQVNRDELDCYLLPSRHTQTQNMGVDMATLTNDEHDPVFVSGRAFEQHNHNLQSDDARQSTSTNTDWLMAQHDDSVTQHTQTNEDDVWGALLRSIETQTSTGGLEHDHGVPAADALTQTALIDYIDAFSNTHTQT